MLNKMFKSIIDQDRSSVVICNTDHIITYMNPAAVRNYSKRGGSALIGKSLMDCHNNRSNELIVKVTEWFKESRDNNIIYTFHNNKDNKDVYMVALRDENGNFIGYYEKHEYRNPETADTYDFIEGKILKGHVYSLSSAVNPLKDGFIYYFLDIKGNSKIQVDFGKDRYFTVGGDSELFIERKNPSGKWEQEHFPVSSLCRDESTEFNLPEYLTSIDVEYEILDEYDFYNGCDTNFDMIWTGNFDIKTGKTIYYDFITVDFKAPVLIIGGKTVDCIQQTDIKSAKGAIEFLLHHINDKAEISMKKLGEILDRIESVNRNSTEFEIRFSDGTRLGGFGCKERINWDDDM